jgi:Nucleolar RNA-binding protein, Nop10p family
VGWMGGSWRVCEKIAPPPASHCACDTMHLMYYMEEGKRVYTLKKTAPDGSPTHSAHPGTMAARDGVVGWVRGGR